MELEGWLQADFSAIKRCTTQVLLSWDGRMDQLQASTKSMAIKTRGPPSIRQGHDRIGHGVKPKAAVRYLCPWLEYLPHKYVRVRFLSKFPGFRQNVKIGRASCRERV